MKNQSLTTRNKAILSDPAAAYAALEIDKDKSSIAALHDLTQRAQSLKLQRKDLVDRCGTLSRQIGIAKRNGNPFEELKASMQEHSRRLKAVENELADTHERILDFFDTIAPAASSRGPSTKPADNKASARRIYSKAGEDIGEVNICLLKDEQHEWNEYVSSNPAATIHHRAEWRELLQQSYGIEGLYFLARDSGSRIVGILPLVRLKSRLFGDFLVSMPWFSRGGAIADHPLIENELIHAANDMAKCLNISHIEYRDDIPREGLQVRTHKVNMVLELPDSTNELWYAFKSKLRAQIKRPLREHPQVLIGGRELLEDFYAVYSRNMRDLGSPAHSRLFIISILKHFPKNSWVIVLRLQDRPVAAGLLLGHGNTLEIPLASTIQDVNALSMNMLMYWEVLKFAIKRGFRYFDFGRSSNDAGTYRFKKQWGAQPKQLYWHYWLSTSGMLPSLNPSNPKYALVITIWKRLPLALSRWLGPLIVKNLP